jgi:hypothetical protein
MILVGANPLLGPLDGMGPENLENLDFFWPKWHARSRCYFRAQKGLDFQGPPLLLALVMELPASKSLRPSPYKQQVH